jgi:hypothetical protein
MATDPNDRNVTFSFPKGTMTGARGLIAYFMNLGSAQWTVGGAGGRKRKYGTRQRSLAAGGKVAYVRLDTDDIHTVRYTGTFQNFIDNILPKSKQGKVVEIMTQSGTKAGPQFVS